MAKVYVSSTRLDLEPERAAVIAWLIQANHQPVHSYVPDSHSVRDGCLNDVAGCDAYILILGHRYGFVPAAGNPDGLSITELEYRRARDLELPCIVLMPRGVRDIAATDLLDPAAYVKVRAFGERVNAAHRSGMFGDEAELIAALSASVQQTLRGKPLDDPEVQRVIAVLATQGAGKDEQIRTLQAENAQLKAISRNKLGEMLLAQGDLRAALESFRGAMEIAQALAARDRGNIEWQRDLSISHIKIGDVLMAQGNLPAALESFRVAMEIGRALAARDPGSTESQRDLSVSHIRIGDVLMAQGDLPAALESFRAAMEIGQALAARDLRNTAWQRDLSTSHNRIGDVLMSQGDLPVALESFRAAREIRQAIVARDRANTGWQRDLSVSQITIGDVLVAQGDLPAALAEFRAGMEIAQTLAAHDRTNVQWQLDVAVSCARLGTHAELADGERKQFLQRGLEVLDRLHEEANLPVTQDWRLWFNQRLAEGQAPAGGKSNGTDRSGGGDPGPPS